MIRLFIGWDSKEKTAFNTFAHSVWRHASEPVLIAPIRLGQIKTFDRERNPLQSTEFSFSRFMVPYLCGFEGWAIFADCDFLCRGDIAELWKQRDDTKAVQVVKHDYTPVQETKFLGNVQTKYQRKNWSSLILFNNARCTALTPDYVNTASGLELHQFKWLHESEIGGIERKWNHLVQEYGYDPKARMVHYTLGGPWFNEYATCDYADEWFYENRLLSRCD